MLASFRRVFDELFSELGWQVMGDLGELLGELFGELLCESDEFWGELGYWKSYWAIWAYR